MSNFDGEIDQLCDLSVTDPNTQEAIYILAKMILNLDERNDLLDARMQEANRMIAQCMIAIVRLELANSCDALTNTILELKRKITGSGNAEVAINFTATLVMIAGNALSGGGMSVIGAVLVAGGKVMIEVGKSKGMEALLAAAAGAAGGVAGGLDGNLTEEIGTAMKGQGASTTSRQKNIADTTITLADGIQSIRELRTAREREVKVNIKKRTAFVPHGAGGTASITADIQQAIVDAYNSVCLQLGRETDTAKHTLKPAAGSILKEIVDAQMPSDLTDAKSLGLHPLTRIVLERALGLLNLNGGDHYSKAIEENNTTKGVKARQVVTAAYGYMGYQLHEGLPLPTNDELVIYPPIKSIIDSTKWF